MSTKKISFYSLTSPLGLTFLTKSKKRYHFTVKEFTLIRLQEFQPRCGGRLFQARVLVRSMVKAVKSSIQSEKSSIQSQQVQFNSMFNRSSIVQSPSRLFKQKNGTHFAKSPSPAIKRGQSCRHESQKEAFLFDRNIKGNR